MIPAASYLTDIDYDDREGSFSLLCESLAFVYSRVLRDGEHDHCTGSHVRLMNDLADDDGEKSTDDANRDERVRYL